MTSELLIVATTLGLYGMAVVSPGPNFALISRLALSGNRPAAVSATLGLAVAATFYAILTMTGLALLLARVGWLASLVQIAGGCYLIFLGIKAWLAAKPQVETEPSTSPQGDSLRGFRMGILINLSNPKVIAFFVGLYALTVPPEGALWAKLLILAGGFLIEIGWYGLVITVLSTQPARAAYNRFGQWIERAIGSVLVVFGMRLISEKP